MREFDHGIRLGRVAAALVTLVASLGVAAPAAAAPPPGLDAARGLRVAAARPAAAGGRSRLAPPRSGIAWTRRGTLTGYDVRVGRRAAAAARTRRVRGRALRWHRRRRRAGRGRHAPGAAGAAAPLRAAPADRGPAGLWQPPGCGGRAPPEPRGARAPGGSWVSGARSPDRSARLRLEIAPPTGELATARPRSATIAWRGRWAGRPLVLTWRCARSGTRTVTRCGCRWTRTPAAPRRSCPLVDPRPVPEEPATRWPRDLLLTYRWHGTETPPSWMRPAINAAADDASRTDRSRAPRFAYARGCPGRHPLHGHLPGRLLRHVDRLRLVRHR